MDARADLLQQLGRLTPCGREKQTQPHHPSLRIDEIAFRPLRSTLHRLHVPLLSRPEPVHWLFGALQRLNAHGQLQLG
jgi:hypothetical protein